MKLAILGATGRIGGHLLNQILDTKGHDVVVLCRIPSKLTVQHEKLQVVEADVFSAESMTPHFTGCDAILSCLGTDCGIRKATLFSDSIKAITAAMRETGVKRLICLTSWFTNYSKSDGGSFVIEWIIKPLGHLFRGRTLSNMAVMEQYLIENGQDINFTVVRPPALEDKPVTDNDFLTDDLQYVRNGNGCISPGDVARFMIRALDTKDYNGKVIAIAT